MPRRSELLRPDQGSEGLQAANGSGLLSTARDLSLAGSRGVEMFGRDLVSLIPGVDPGEDLFVDRLVGFETETAVGGLANGIVNFLAGFVPGLGLVGKFGKIGRIANLTRKGERAARIAGKYKVATSINIGRSAAAGALADFTAFDGNEERLSNFLIGLDPSLSNVVTEFLAADEDDPELIGRGKQVLEGLGVGFLGDALFLGLRGIKAQRGARARAEALPGDAAKAVDQAVPGRGLSDELDKARRVVGLEEPASDAPKLLSERTVKDPVTGEAKKIGGRRKKKQRGGRRRGRADSPVGAGTPKKDRAVLKVLSRTDEGRRRILKERLRYSDEQIQRALKEWQFRAARGSAGIAVDKTGRLSPDPWINPRNFSDLQLATLGVEPKGLNLAATIADEDVGFLARSFEALFGPLPADARIAVPNDETFARALEEVSDIAQAAEAGDLLPRLIEGAIERTDMLRQATRLGVGLKSMFVTYGGEILERLANTTGPVQAFQGLDDVRNLALLGKFIREGSSEGGRGFQAEKIAARNLKDIEFITAQLEAAGGKESVDRILEAVKFGFGDGGVEGAAAAVRIASLTMGGKALALTTEFWINSVLSGAKTFATNLVSPLLHSVHMPMENLVGGALTGQPAVIRRSFDQIQGLFTSFQESMRMGAKSFREGKLFLDPMRSVRDDPFSRLSSIDPRANGVDPNSASGAALTFASRFINLPTRLLMASDEFVKQLNYRTVVRSRLTEQGIENGLARNSPALARHITEGLDGAIVEGQAISVQNFRRNAERMARSAGFTDRLAIEQFVAKRMKDFDPSLSRFAQEGLVRANEGAFTTALEAGTLARGYQTLRDQHPLLILMTPFVRTPVNLVRSAAQRFPNPFGITEAIRNRQLPPGAPELAKLKTKFAREVLSGDPDRVAQAVGRQAFGLSAFSFLAGVVAQGQITGRGPTDKETRDLYTAAGWQPYSVRVGDKWLSYLRLDPYATIIGTVADVYDYARLAPSDEQENLGTLTMSTLMALANNFTNKTYLQGLSQVVDALSDPSKIPSVFSRFASAVVPNALAQAVELSGDETMRDINGFLERIRSRVPGWSDTVPPMRNLFGEVQRRPRGFALGLENLPGTMGDLMSMISPIVYRDVQDEAVSAELIELKHGFSPPSSSRFQVDLLDVKSGRGQSAWDRWLQLHGQVKVGGRTMQAELRRLIASRTYRQLSPISTSSATSPRVEVISNVITEYRDTAWEQMLKEFPILQRDLQSRGRARRVFLSRRRQETFRLGGVVPTVGNIGGN